MCHSTCCLHWKHILYSWTEHSKLCLREQSTNFSQFLNSISTVYPFYHSKSDHSATGNLSAFSVRIVSGFKEFHVLLIKFPCATFSPLTVLQKILLGALKWYGPRDGLVFILLRRKARYFTVERHTTHLLNRLTNTSKTLGSGNHYFSM